VAHKVFLWEEFLNSINKTFNNSLTKEVVTKDSIEEITEVVEAVEVTEVDKVVIKEACQVKVASNSKIK
jgi:hypothetical protein